jgi:hypothetical protein
MLRTSILVSTIGSALSQMPVLTEICDKSNLNQTFTQTNCDANNACSYVSGSYPTMCISSNGDAELSQLVLAKCDPSDHLQQFVWSSGSGQMQQLPTSNNLCWNVDGGTNEPAGTPIILYGCGSMKEIAGNDVFWVNAPFQNGIFSNSSGDSGLCLDLTGPPPPPPPPFEWFFIAGQANGPDVIPSQTMALDDAKALCLATPNCHALTFQGAMNPPSNITYYFRSNTVPQNDQGWNSLLNCGVVSPCV